MRTGIRDRTATYKEQNVNREQERQYWKTFPKRRCEKYELKTLAKVGNA